MATLYFNAAVDQDWNTLGNWWTDEACTIPATSLPTSNDSAVLSSSCSVSEKTVMNLLVTGGGLSGSITVNGTATFNGTASNSGTITGSATFNGTASNSGTTINGTAAFNDYAVNGGNVYGTATFNDHSNNTNTGDPMFGGLYGSVYGDATFNDNAYNAAYVAEDATFSGRSRNDGSVVGDAVFYGRSYNDNYVGGDAVFNDESYNAYTVSGDAAFNDNSYNVGSVGGTATYNGGLTGVNQYGPFVNGQRGPALYYNAGVNGDWFNLGNWWTDPACTVPATNLPASSDSVVVSGYLSSSTGGEPTVANLSSRAGFGFQYSWDVFHITVTGIAALGGNNWAVIDGDCVFTEGMENYGTVTGSAMFYDDSTNRFFFDSYGDSGGNRYGTVGTNATFNQDSQNYSIVQGNAVFNDNSQPVMGTIAGNAVFNDYARPALAIAGGNGYASIAGSVTLSLTAVTALIGPFISPPGGGVIFKYEKGINGSSILGLI